MNDLVSRQSVIDLFEAYRPYMAVRVIEFGKALKELPSYNLWVPCSARNPSKSGEYYVTERFGNTYIKFHAYYSVARNEWSVKGDAPNFLKKVVNDIVVAWMDIEPWRGDV